MRIGPTMSPMDYEHKPTKDTSKDGKIIYACVVDGDAMNRMTAWCIRHSVELILDVRPEGHELPADVLLAADVIKAAKLHPPNLPPATNNFARLVLDQVRSIYYRRIMAHENIFSQFIERLRSLDPGKTAMIIFGPSNEALRVYLGRLILRMAEDRGLPKVGYIDTIIGKTETDPVGSGERRELVKAGRILQGASGKQG